MDGIMQEMQDMLAETRSLRESASEYVKENKLDLALTDREMSRYKSILDSGTDNPYPWESGLEGLEKERGEILASLQTWEQTVEKMVKREQILAEVIGMIQNGGFPAV